MGKSYFSGRMSQNYLKYLDWDGNDLTNRQYMKRATF